MSADRSIPTKVYIEETGATVQLYLTPEEYQRATNDPEYVMQLVNNVEVPQETSQPGPSSQSAEQERISSDDTNMFIWTNSAVLLFLSLYEDKIDQFNGQQRHKKVWAELASEMKASDKTLNVTGLQCQTKMNGLKRTYKKIIDHNNTSGNDRASWPFFDRMHEIFGTNRWAQPLAVASERGPLLSEPQPSKNPRTAKKAKLECLLDEQIKENKKKRQERQDRFNKIMETKERHHQDKLRILKDFLNKKPL